MCMNESMGGGAVCEVVLCVSLPSIWKNLFPTGWSTFSLLNLTDPAAGTVITDEILKFSCNSGGDGSGLLNSPLQLCQTVLNANMLMSTLTPFDHRLALIRTAQADFGSFCKFHGYLFNAVFSKLSFLYILSGKWEIGAEIYWNVQANMRIQYIRQFKSVFTLS